MSTRRTVTTRKRGALDATADRAAPRRAVLSPPAPAVLPARKLCLGDARDPAEGEATRVAASVAQAREARQVWSKTSASSVATDEPAPPSVTRVLNSGAGRPLPATVRLDFEDQLGHDLNQVRVHTSAPASQSARAIGARAYTRGADVVFGAGQYAPHVPSGRQLLAHELAHVVQQQRNPATRHVVRRAPESEARQKAPAGTVDQFIKDPPAAAMFVTTMGLTLRPPESATLAPGSRAEQLMAVVLRTVLINYDPKLVAPFVEILRSSGWTSYGFEEGSAAEEGGTETEADAGPSPVPEIFLDAVAATAILWGLKVKLGLPLSLTDEQETVLVLGLIRSKAWAEVLQLNLGPGQSLPGWYNEYIFDRRMAERRVDLELYARGLDLVEGTKAGEDPEADDWRRAALTVITDSLKAEAEPLEAIRVDSSLLVPTPGLEGEAEKREATAAAMYRAIFAVAESGSDPATAPTRVSEDSFFAAAFIGFSNSQPGLSDRAAGDRDARVELLRRYANFLGRVHISSSGTEQLEDDPSTYNAPPFPASLTAFPALPGPIYQASLDAERRFEMRFQFREASEAFSVYDFRWDRLAVEYTPPLTAETTQATDTQTPNAGAGEPAPLEKPSSEFDENAVATSIAAAETNTAALNQEEGSAISDLDLAQQRFTRAMKYHEEDMRTMFTTFGPAGIVATDLVNLNALLRYTGTGLKTLLDSTLTGQSGNHSEKIVTFPQPGLYMVRAIGTARLTGEEEIVRPPSVAYHPVFVRPPEEIAAAAVYASRQRADDERALETEIDRVLVEEDLTFEEFEALSQMRAEFEAHAQGLQASLQFELAAIEREITRLETDKQKNQAELALLATEKERLQTLLGMQTTRALKAPRPLRVTFVTDAGETIPLRMEVETSQPAEGAWNATVSDLTSIRGGIDHGTGETEEQAIRAAVKNLLQSGFGYGRGIAAIELGTRIESERIAASAAQITSEGIENLTTVLSIAAIAAAPFTGGATLTLLIPIGAVGAIPSVYRLVTKQQAATLRFDFETAMDVVNIAGAIFAVGQAGVAGRVASLTQKGVRPGVWTLRAGKALMIGGFATDAGGVILMGGGIVAQLQALNGLSPAEREAAILQILGGALLQAGITVGGSLAARGVELRNQQAVAALDRVNTDQPPVGETRIDVETGKTEPRADSAQVPTDVQTKAAEEGVNPALADAVKVSDRPGEPPLTDSADANAGKTEESATGRKTAGTLDTKPTTDTAPSDPAAQARADADPLVDALARGDKAPEVKLPALSAPKTIPPDFTWDIDIADWGHALARYEEARAAAPGREVAVWRNPENGTYAVTIGTNAEVNPPFASLDWIGVLHYHPNPDNTVRLRMPSPNDFAQLMLRWQQGNQDQTLREFVDWGLPGKDQGRTEFGISPDPELPFYVVMHAPGGKPYTTRFRDDGHYTQEWAGQEIFVGPEMQKVFEAEIIKWSEQMRGKVTEFEGARSTASTGGKTKQQVQREAELRAVEEFIAMKKAKGESIQVPEAPRRDNSEFSRLIEEAEEFLETFEAPKPSPETLAYLSVQGTKRHTALNWVVVPELQKRMPPDTLFSTRNWAQLERVLAITTLPWGRGTGPDLILVDLASKKVRVFDLASSPSAKHVRDKQHQTSQLAALLGPAWDVKFERDIHLKGDITSDRLIALMGAELTTFGLAPKGTP